MYKYTFLITIIWSFTCSFAQKPYIRFEYLGSENGLISNYTEDIIQDNDGFIWCATDKGVSRYDGTEFSSYNSSEGYSKNFTEDLIHTLFLDNNNELWAGTLPSGISRYNRERDIFKNYKQNDSTRDINRIYQIYEDDEGIIWICSAAGLLKYNVKSDSVQIVELTHRLLSVIEHNGYLWLGTDQDGIHVYDPITGSVVKKYAAHEGINSLPGVSIHEIIKDKNGDIWVGTMNGGLARYNERSDNFDVFPIILNGEKITEAITNICFATNGYTYLAGDNLGLIVLSPSMNEVYQYKADFISPYGFKANTVTGIIEDRDQTIWLSTYAGGIYNFSSLSSSFHEYKAGPGSGSGLGISLTHPYVSGFAEDINGNLWIGLDGDGINILNRQENRIRYVNSQLDLEDKAVTGLSNDKSGNIWVSTWSSGILKIPDTKNSVSFHNYINYENNQLIRLKSLMADSKDRVWTADHYAGIQIYDNKKNRLYNTYNRGSFPDELFDIELITSVAEDFDSNIWIITYTGLYKYIEKEKRVVVYRGNSPNAPLGISEKVYDLCINDKNEVWLSTNSSLLKYVVEEDSFINYTNKIGVPPALSLICCQDNIWMASSLGLVKFNTFSETYELFDDGYSMLGNTFSERAAYETHDGFLCFGGKDGFIMFHPDSIKLNTTPPVVHITKIEVMGIEQRPVDSLSILKNQAYLTKKIELSPKQTALSLSFTAVSYVFSDKNKFMYMLEGYDQDWVLAKNIRTASYMNLEPGNYTFKVKAANNDNVWSTENAELQIHVHPPIYKTVWFRLALILLLVALLLSMYYIKTRNYKLRKKWLESEVQQRTIEINVVNSELNERNEQLSSQKEEVESQRDLILNQNIELEEHRNNLGELVNRRTIDLEKAKDKAEESDKLKSAFLHNLSHEIRTPLNAIIGFTELLGDPVMDEDEIKEAKTIITRSSHNLLEIIDDIIQASLIDSRQLKVHKKNIKVTPLLKHLESFYRELIEHEGKDIELKLTIKIEEDTELEVDKKHLEKTLNHFLQNAVKFTEKGTIVFGCEVLGNKIEFYVEDTGFGISNEDIEHIFERFRKFDSESKQFMSGTGLGLAFTKWFVEQHQGEIWVDSILGEGTKFTFSLPLSAALKNSKPPESTNMENISKNEFSVLQNLADKTVLIAEDNESNFKYISAIFKRTNINILRAYDGVEAVAMFKEYPIDLVLMDLKMPNMDGYEALEAIKKIDPRINVIAQTAFVHHESKDALIDMGFDEYIYKPIDKHQLLELISKFLINE